MSERIPVKVITPVKVHKPEGLDDRARYTPRSHIYVRKVEGMLETLRRFFGLFFLGLFVILPWLQFDGHQAILLDIGAQRFNIFGLTLWPQDLTLLAWIFIVAAFALFFVTTFAGRVWCGFMCPQTTWTFIFIWFEEQIEGSRNKRIKLDERTMDFDKFWRKTLKHTSWIGVALLTALIFVGYFTPIEVLFVEFFTGEAPFWAAFSVIFFTFCTYGNAGWMREIMCTHICPYARFQSAMFDKDTFTVAYNPSRGEKRGPRGRKMTPEQRLDKGLGDCIDCNLCVQVCPTGIDIRNGLQYECINCGACVDACNGVMDKMNYEKGLISFTSEHQLAGGKTEIFRPKLIGYAVVLTVMVGLLALEIATRIPLEVDIIRDRGALYRETNDGLIENVYTLKILNKSQLKTLYHVSIEGLPGHRYSGEDLVTVEGGEAFSLPISVAIDESSLEESITSIKIHVTGRDTKGESVEVEEPTKFIFQ
jgi:cytochrome c oxidase accessory protein FixG